MLKTNSILLHIIYPLILGVLLSSCANVYHSVGDVKDDTSFAESSKGLLLGSVHWVQKSEAIEVKENDYRHFSVFFKNIGTNRQYMYIMKKSDFAIALPPGNYELTSIHAPTRAFHRSSAWVYKEIADFTLLLVAGTAASVATGVNLGPAFSGWSESVPVPVDIPSFVLRQREATYIGSLIIEVPDPLPYESFIPRLKINDEGDAILKDIQTRFPSILHIEKHLQTKITDGL